MSTFQRARFVRGYCRALKIRGHEPLAALREAIRVAQQRKDLSAPKN